MLGLDFLRRTGLEALAAGAVMGTGVALLGHPAVGAGILAGAAWGAANLWALTGFLLQELARRARRGSRRSFLGWAFIKFPLLYGAGYLLLGWGRMPAEALAGGFSLLFLVWFAEAAWRSLAGSGAGPEREIGGERTGG